MSETIESLTARDTKALARKFAEIICATLTGEELAEVCRLNATPEYADCCATHDFCDANMPMLEAYSVVSCTPEDDVDVTSDEVIDIMSRAWDLAKAAEFQKEWIK